MLVSFMGGSMKKFWIVWNPARGLPRKQHLNYFAALSEAMRLAGQHHGEEFLVLEFKAGYKSPKPETPPIQVIYAEEE